MGLLDRIRRSSAAAENHQRESDVDALRLAELVPERGRWAGLLFDNPSIGLPPALTWTFELPFGEVSRSFGTSAVVLTVDWVPLPGAVWSAMDGQAASCDVFGEPIECSVYFFEHYRYDSVELRILEQAGNRIRVSVEARGDVDGLGVPTWTVGEWLDFDGVYVELSDVETIDQAAAELASYTDSTGLVGAASGHNFKFAEPGK
jgi:hypothetical protein